MSKRDVVQSHVEALCEQMLEVNDVKVMPNGEIPVCHRSAIYRLRVLHGEVDPHVEVYAVAIEDIDADPGLYEALNEINSHASHFRAFWTDRKVILATELVGKTLDLEELECTCDEIAKAADVDGRRLATVYGGYVARPEYEGEDE